MYAVVNRLTFAEPVGEAVAAKFASAMPAIRESARRAYFTQTGSPSLAFR